jgi:hypothetical protein
LRLALLGFRFRAKEGGHCEKQISIFKVSEHVPLPQQTNNMKLITN